MIRQIQKDDFLQVYKLVQATQTLDVHHPYAYWLMFNHSPELCCVVERDEIIVGFATAMKHFGSSNAVFLWQIGVLPDFHQQGIGTQLAEHVIQQAFSTGFQEVYFTTTPDNLPTIRLFEKVTGQLGRHIEVKGSTGNQGKLIKEEIIFRIY